MYFQLQELITGHEGHFGRDGKDHFNRAVSKDPALRAMQAPTAGTRIHLRSSGSRAITDR